MGIATSIRSAFSRENLISVRATVLSNSLEALTLFWLTAFFLFYGLVPIFGGSPHGGVNGEPSGVLGLVGR